MAVDDARLAQGGRPAPRLSGPGAQRRHRPVRREGLQELRGTAVPHDDPPTHERYAEAVTAPPGSPEVGRFRLFAVDIEQATYIRHDNATGDRHVAIRPPARELWRCASSATRVGEQEPVRDLLQ